MTYLFCQRVRSLRRLRFEYWGLKPEEILDYLTYWLSEEDTLFLRKNTPSNLLLYLLASTLCDNDHEDNMNWLDISLEVFDRITANLFGGENGDDWGLAPFEPLTATQIAEEAINFFESVEKSLVETDQYLDGKRQFKSSVKSYVASEESL